MLKTPSDQQHNERLVSSHTQIGLAFLAFLLIGANDGAFGVLIPSISVHYQINKATISLLFLANTVGYLVAAFNNGLLIVKLGERAFLLLGLASLGLSMGTLVLMPPFLVVLIVFLPVGFGIAVLDAGLNSYIARLPRNTALLNYLHACYGTGALLGPFLASTMLALSFGWNSVYLVLAGSSTLLFVGVTGAFRNAPKQQEKASREASSGNKLLRSILRMRVIWLVALFLFCYVGSEHSLGSWSYSFLTEQRHAPPLFSGWIVSGYWLGLTLGRITLAWIAQRLGEQRLIQYCLLGVFGSALLIWLFPILPISALGLCLLGFSLGPIFPTTIALTSRLVSGRLLPSAIGFLSSLSSIGTAFFPWLVGNLAQHLSLEILFPYVLLLTLAMFGFWLALQRRSTSRESI
ncbi:MAG: MFS transporter [Chloroflexota bacterium]|nr:MFS transporter [Chloroflexota bacterium]